jgi:choline-sulfatase
VSDRPNIIVIMSDEHDPAVTGCYRDPVVETPNLDRLAREGVTFDACYTTSPLCVPARLSFTAGQYVSRCGAWSNSCRLPAADYPSLPRLLQSAGYETYLCGKQHYDRTYRYGFGDILPEIHSNRARKHGRGGRRAADDTNADRRSWEARSAQFHAGEDSPILSHDRAVTDRACRFLREWREGYPPFFLFVGHLSPHFPLIVPEAIHEKYRGRVPMPELPEGLVENLPFNYHALRRGFGMEETDPEVVRRGRELYWALVDWYDAHIGEILQALEAGGAAENTVVLYTSDHGENKGDHGLWWKNNMYEHSARIPLIARWPGQWPAGERRGGACSLVDVVQTIAEIAGTAPPAEWGWDGESFLPLLADGNAPWKDAAVSEYYGHNIASGMTMLRQGPWKYIYHNRPDQETPPARELFNLAEDPQEFHNLADEPRHAERLAAMHATLVAELGEEPDAIEARCRRDYATGYDEA